MKKFGLREKDWERIVNILASFPELDEAILYGSRAMDTHKPYSDIDIALKGKALNLTLLSKIDMALDDLFLPYKFDLTLYHHISSPELIDHIKRVGKILFTKPQVEIPVFSY